MYYIEGKGSVEATLSSVIGWSVCDDKTYLLIGVFLFSLVFAFYDKIVLEQFYYLTVVRYCWQIVLCVSGDQFVLTRVASLLELFSVHSSCVMSFVEF